MIYALLYFLIGYVGFIVYIKLWDNVIPSSDYLYLFFLSWFWPFLLPALYVSYWSGDK